MALAKSSGGKSASGTTGGRKKAATSAAARQSTNGNHAAKAEVKVDAPKPPIREKIDILIVDDVPEKLIALEAVLTPLNQNLVRATSGRDALRLILKQDFAVIILDINMPGIDGFETAALIRQRKQSEHTPIIFVTSFSTGDAEIYRGYSLGAVDYLFAPVLPEVLRSKVSVFIELERKTREIRNQADTLFRLNTELKNQAQDLLVLNQELESFTYSISHDLRAPLRAISGYSQMLLSGEAGDIPNEGVRLLKSVSGNSARMLRLIDDFHNFFRFSREEIKPSPIDMDATVKDVISELAPVTGDHPVEFQIGTLPAARGDPSMVGQVMVNLVSNAVKFSARSEKPKVEIGCLATQRPSVYYVKDNGVGFNMEHYGKLFGVFQRLHVDADFEGTGIGLAIVHKIVRRHGGRIWAEAKVNAGATFYFTLAPSGKETGASQEEPK